ncbi:MAG: glycerol-3-phosphate 1-O-acyltransferase PlsY [Ruminococcaceae bacterium]|nr:glycerol-3-phosphate 1-O-acyltransferase PlsY [Oscillospiraceae bacterium]
MKMNRLLCLALSICLIFTIFLSVGMTAYAQEKNADELEIIESKEVDPPAFSYHSLRYYGGLVTRIFGTFEKHTYNMPLYEDVPESNVILVSRSSSPQYEVTLVLCCLMAYMLGSVNFATFISGRKYKDDVRNHGSGNAGMTNMLRTFGKKAALLTLLGDFGKAVISVLIGILLVGDMGGYFAAMFCIVGHAFPVFYRFKGGKGVACTAAVILMLEPMVFLFLFSIFALVFLLTKYVSLSAIMAMLFYPVILSRFYGVGHRDLVGVGQALPLHVAIISVMIACFVIFLHRSNIKRLYNRQESKTYLFKKKKKEQNTEKI